MNRLLREDLIINSSSTSFYNPDFMQVLDSHREYFRTAGNPEYRVIDSESKGRYIGDFYAVLHDMRIAPKYHRIVMQLNGITNPIQYDNQLLQVFIPDFSKIDRLLSIYNSGVKSLKLSQEGQ